MTKNVLALALLCGTFMATNAVYASDYSEKETGFSAAIPFVAPSVLEKARSVFDHNALTQDDLKDLMPSLSAALPNTLEQISFLLKTAPLTRRTDQIKDKIDLLRQSLPFFPSAFSNQWFDTVIYLNRYTDGFDTPSLISTLSQISNAIIRPATQDHFYLLKLGLPFLDFLANPEERKKIIPLILSTLADTPPHQCNNTQQALMTFVPELNLQDAEQHLVELSSVLSPLDQSELPFILYDLEPVFAGCSLEQKIQRLRMLTPFFAAITGDERTDVMKKIASILPGAQHHPVSEQLIEALQPHITMAPAGKRLELLEALLCPLNRLSAHGLKLSFLTKVSQYFAPHSTEEKIFCLKTLNNLTTGMTNIPLLRMYETLFPLLHPLSGDNQKELQKLLPVMSAIPMDNVKTRVSLIQQASNSLHDMDRFVTHGQSLIKSLPVTLLPEAFACLSSPVGTPYKELATFDEHLSFFGPTLCAYWEKLETFRGRSLAHKTDVFFKVKSLSLHNGQATPDILSTIIRDLDALRHTHPTYFNELSFFVEGDMTSQAETITFLSHTPAQNDGHFMTFKPLMSDLTTREKKRFLAQDPGIVAGSPAQALTITSLIARTLMDGQSLAKCYQHAQGCAAQQLDAVISSFGFLFKGITSGHEALLQAATGTIGHWPEAGRGQKMRFVKQYVTDVPDGALRAGALNAVSSFDVDHLFTWQLYLKQSFINITNPEKRAAFLADLQNLNPHTDQSTILRMYRKYAPALGDKVTQ